MQTWLKMSTRGCTKEEPLEPVEREEQLEKLILSEDSDFGFEPIDLLS